MRWRSVIYEQDYVSYWNSKGDYGKIRVARMRERKLRRNNKMMDNIRDRKNRYGFCSCCGRGHYDNW